MEFLSDSMKSDLITLWKIQNDIQKTASMIGIEVAEGHVRELLDKAQEFIAKYNPERCALHVGGTSGSGMSFTWESKRKPAPRLLAEV